MDKEIIELASNTDIAEYSVNVTVLQRYKTTSKNAHHQTEHCFTL